jgi:hypothetical protein
MSIAQTNKFILEYVNPGALMLKIVTIKLREPSMDEIPVKCSAKIAQSTDIFGEKLVERGGYTVQPVPAPISVKKLSTKNITDSGSNQKLKLFSLGKAISVVPHITGINQFPKPDIKIGITEKNIITIACAVTVALYSS